MTAREAALSALNAYRRSDAWSDAYLNGLFKKNNMEPRERALATRLCGSVLQNRLLIDFYISQFLKGKIEALHPTVLDILRISVCQLLFFDRIPASASVNEGVNLAKRNANKGASGLVNAVLRRIAENKDRPVPPKEPWLLLSHTKEWYNYFSGLVGEEKTLALMQADNSEAPITLRANTLKNSVPELLDELNGQGITAEPHPWLEGCFLMKGAGEPDDIPAFRDGKMTVQDAGAALAVVAAAPKKGERVLDACSAPGGKSFLAAMMMENCGSVLSCDIHENKLSRVKKGAERLGISIISTAAMDASVRNEELVGGFDLVIADVPCSGMGVIRKKPEIRYKAFADISALPDIQLGILKNLSAYVRPGGRLLYSTCTLIREENEFVIDAFLRDDPSFEREGFTLPEPVGICAEGEKTLWPYEYGTDGFYICLLRKKTENEI